MKDLGVAGLLIIGLVGSMVLSFFQHRYYTKTVQRLIREGQDPDATLVSGRHKGKLRGAVALLIVGPGPDPVIERAAIMVGASVMARFHDRPELVGPLSALPGRGDNASTKAVGDAIANYWKLAERHASPQQS
jgi:glucitol operon activator protein